jgi:hypothetical protein
MTAPVLRDSRTWWEATKRDPEALAREALGLAP